MGTAFFYSSSNAPGKHVRFHMIKIFHLHGTDRCSHLQPGIPGILQRSPGSFHSVRLERYGYCNPCVPHRLRNRTDQQAVDLFLGDFLQFNQIDIQLVQQPAQFNLFTEAQLRAFSALAQGTVTDPDHLSISHVQTSKKISPEAVRSRDENIAVPPLLLHKVQSPLGLRQVHSLLRGVRVSLQELPLVHKTGSGSSQISFMYCLSANDSSLQQSGEHSFLHCL